MAETYDVAARLSEGMSSVGDIEEYVAAYRGLGRQHPDLTAHAAQVREWYAGEEGLNLLALDADCAALRAVAAMADDAVARQDAALGALPAAWQGGGADASHLFLRGHDEASVLAVAATQAAAQALSDLREDLWRAVDDKVTTVMAIDASVQPRRAEWLAASRTVVTGAGDRAVASELVDQEVTPFVDNVIGGQWVPAMRTASAAIEAAYDQATAELASEPDAIFDVPGDLGPTWSVVRDSDVATTPAGVAAPVAAAPAFGGVPVGAASGGAAPGGWGTGAWGAPAAPPMSPAPPLMAASPAAPAAPPSAPPVDPAAAAPPPMPSSPPSLGGGLPDVGGGLSGLGQQLGETLGGLFGSADDALPDSSGPPELEELTEADTPADMLEESEPDAEDEEAEDDAEADAEDTDEHGPDAPADPDADVGCEPPQEEPPPVAAEVPAAATPPPLPPPAPMPPDPLPPPEPASATGTPCEIAADELPQVGE